MSNNRISVVKTREKGKLEDYKICSAIFKLSHGCSKLHGEIIQKMEIINILINTLKVLNPNDPQVSSIIEDITQIEQMTERILELHMDVDINMEK